MRSTQNRISAESLSFQLLRSFHENVLFGNAAAIHPVYCSHSPVLLSVSKRTAFRAGSTGHGRLMPSRYLWWTILFSRCHGAAAGTICPWFDGHCSGALVSGKTVIAKKIEILRIAEGRDHSAEVSGTVLQNEQERRVLFLSSGGKNKPAQWQKSQKAVSLVRSIEPNMVITTSAVHTPRTVEKVCTIRWERAEKICRSRKAPTTASTQNRQASVLRS